MALSHDITLNVMKFLRVKIQWLLKLNCDVVLYVYSPSVTNRKKYKNNKVTVRARNMAF